MFSWLVPHGHDSTFTIGTIAVHFIVGGMIGVVVLARRLRAAAWYVPPTICRLLTVGRGCGSDIRFEEEDRTDRRERPCIPITPNIAQIPPEEGHDFSYHTISYPLESFAKQYGHEEYMPYLCNPDYVMSGVFGIPPFREHTCSEDGDYCDFKIEAGEEPMEYWPPVFTQGQGYK